MKAHRPFVLRAVVLRPVFRGVLRAAIGPMMGMVLASAGIALAAAAPANMPSLPPSSGPGASLVDQVRHEIRMLPNYTVFDDLSFRVEGGTVTLAGQVTEPVLKSNAENAVKRLGGVAKVDNQIEVMPVSGFDRQIRMRTYFAIYGFGPLERYGAGVYPSIHILVKDGHVTLKGVVDSEADRNMAYIRANQVPGVFSVTNELSVDKHS